MKSEQGYALTVPFEKFWRGKLKKRHLKLSLEKQNFYKILFKVKADMPLSCRNPL